MRHYTMRRFPIAEMTTPKAGMFHIKIDAWWAVSENNEIYFFGTPRNPYASPQCNASRIIAERIMSDRAVIDDPKMKNCELTGYKQVRQIPVVYVPLDLDDYREDLVRY